MPTKYKISPIALQAEKTAEVAAAADKEFQPERAGVVAKLREYAETEAAAAPLGPKASLEAAAVAAGKTFADAHKDAVLAAYSNADPQKTYIDNINAVLTKFDAATAALKAKPQPIAAADQEKIAAITEFKKQFEAQMKDFLLHANHLHLFMENDDKGKLARQAMVDLEALRKKGKEIRADAPEADAQIQADEPKIKTLDDFRKQINIFGKNALKQDPSTGEIACNIAWAPFRNKAEPAALMAAMAASDPRTAPGQKIKITGPITRDKGFMKHLLQGLLSRGYNLDDIRIEKWEKADLKKPTLRTSQMTSAREYIKATWPREGLNEGKIKELQDAGEASRAKSVREAKKENKDSKAGALLAGLDPEKLGEKYGTDGTDKAQMLHLLAQHGGEAGAKKAADLFATEADPKTVFDGFLNKVKPAADPDEATTLGNLNLSALTTEQQDTISALLENLPSEKLKELCAAPAPAENEAAAVPAAPDPTKIAKVVLLAPKTANELITDDNKDAVKEPLKTELPKHLT
ncbi:MAG: hypothetical protein KAT71_07975, partial [Gammaproteobacteria bacterium]|nr:hypothetical protein [Gammaproteobacteria bacterium]